MNLKLTALLTALVLLGAGCSQPVPDWPKESAQLETPIKLSIGSPIQFADGLEVTLTAINDSRCAKDVVCIWAGELSPVFQVSGGQLGGTSEVIMGETTKPSTDFGPYTMALVDVTETKATITVTVTR